MKCINLFFSLFSMLFLLISCGSSDDDFNSGPIVDDCLGLGAEQLSLKIQDHYTTLPGKVSVLFKVTTKDGNHPVAGLTANNLKFSKKVQMTTVISLFLPRNPMVEFLQNLKFSILTHF